VEAADWVSRYEALRRRAMEDGPAATGWGFALFVGRGLVAWMRAWSRGSARPVERAAGAIATDSPTLTLSSSVYRQMAAIVATMILDMRKEVLA